MINTAAADCSISLKFGTQSLITWHPIYNKRSRSRGQRSGSQTTFSKMYFWLRDTDRLFIKIIESILIWSPITLAQCATASAGRHRDARSDQRLCSRISVKPRSQDFSSVRRWLRS